VNRFHRETQIPKTRIEEMIKLKLIESELDEDGIVWIRYKDKSTTLNGIERNKRKLAKESEKRILQEEKEKEKKNKYDEIDPDEPRVGSILRLTEWVKWQDKLTYTQLKTALDLHLFKAIPTELLYTEDHGKNDRSTSWELEYPGRYLANEIGKIIAQGGRNPEIVARSITQMLKSEGYKQRENQEEENAPSPETSESMVTREEFDKLKTILKNKINKMEAEFVEKINAIGTMARRTEAMAKESQTTIRYMATHSKAVTVNQEPDLVIKTDDGWDNFE